MRLAGAAMSEDADQRILTVLERALNPQIDFFRERLRAGYAKQSENGLRGMLATLPGETSPYLVFRIKANIGNCLAQLGDIPGALRWLDEAVAAAPREPKAIATQAFALILRKQLKDAVAFTRAELALDPNNEELAGYLIDACIGLDDGTDPEEMIPAGLQHRERVLLARCLLARQRDQQERWWSLARLGAQTYQQSYFFKLFAAEADVDEIARATRNDNYRALTDIERGKIQSSADILENIWLGIKGSEVPNREDGLSALSTCGVAYRLLENAPKAIELSGELVDSSDYEPALILAVQIALTFNDDELASRGLAKLPSHGAAGFFKGVLEFNKGNWSEAAQTLRDAEIPEVEGPFVAQLLRLASLSSSEDQTDEVVLDNARQGAVEELRALIVIAKVAHRRGFAQVASRAYSDAIALLGPETSHLARLAIASYAHSTEDYSTVIRALDGHLDLGAITPELLQLSDAHALERPARQRNLTFYGRLTPAVRSHLRIARGYASVLTDRHRYSEAQTVLKHAIQAFPKDAYIRLKLIEVYGRTNRDDKVREFVIETDETSFIGPPIYNMHWAHQLRDAGEFSRALSLAYQTLEAHPDDPQLALGYVRLILGDSSQSIIPNQTDVGRDCWVMIEDDLGRTDSFIVGDGPTILGLEVVSVHQERAKRLLGKKVNTSFETSDLGGQQRVWTVKEIKSKYLQVLHTVMQSFQTRFPSTPGLWNFTIVQGDIKPFLDIVKARVDSQQNAVRELYLKGLPLAITARSIGMDVTGFAYLIRSMGLDIVTAGGTSAECDQGIYAARDHRNRGAVLDEYTAIVAAEIGALPLLQLWFGTLTIPASVIDELDTRIDRAKADLGRTQISLGIVNGDFVRQDINDEFLGQQIDALRSVKQKIEDHCAIEPVAFPDTIAEEIASLYQITGQRVLEPMFLAVSRGEVLLSDDLHYRQIAAALTKVDATWLQATVIAAQLAGIVNKKDQTSITAGLAVRRHGNLWLNSQSLAIYFDEGSAAEFAALCYFIGNIGADMASHTVVTARFLSTLWRTRKATLARDARTSCILSALVRHRKEDWAVWIGYIWIYSNRHLKNYIRGWLIGHFLPSQTVEDAIKNWFMHFFEESLVRGQRKSL